MMNSEQLSKFDQPPHSVSKDRDKIFTEDNPVDKKFLMKETPKNSETIDRDRLRKKEPYWRPEVLVLGPGGVKGFLELGTLLCFESCGFIDNVHSIAGCSVGSIIGLLLISGYSVSEIIDIARSLDIFNEIDMDSLDLKKMGRNMGFMSNKPIKEQLENLIMDKFGIIPTLYQLYNFTGIKFCAVASAVSTDSVAYLTAETEPELSCVDAVLLSSNIPYMFYRLKYRGVSYIDGAFANPYPINYYDDGKTNILGIYITSSIIHNENKDDFWSYFMGTTHMAINELRRWIIKDCSCRCKHLPLISSPNLGGFSSSVSDKGKMLGIGYYAGQKFYQSILQEGNESLKSLRRCSKDCTDLDIIEKDTDMSNLFQRIKQNPHDVDTVNTIFDLYDTTDDHSVEEFSERRNRTNFDLIRDATDFATELITEGINTNKSISERENTDQSHEIRNCDEVCPLHNIECDTIGNMKLQKDVISPSKKDVCTEKRVHFSDIQTTTSQTSDKESDNFPQKVEYLEESSIEICSDQPNCSSYMDHLDEPDSHIRNVPSKQESPEAKISDNSIYVEVPPRMKSRISNNLKSKIIKGKPSTQKGLPLPPFMPSLKPDMIWSHNKPATNPELFQNKSRSNFGDIDKDTESELSIIAEQLQELKKRYQKFQESKTPESKTPEPETPEPET